MTYEVVTVTYRDGRTARGVAWANLFPMVQRGELPSNALLTDEATGQTMPVGDVPSLMSLKSTAPGEGVSVLIPYKNKPALIGYYLGVFSFVSIIPVLGLIAIPMSIAALVLGIKGLKVVRENPQAHGTAHAWIAIICGGLFLLFSLAWAVFMLIAVFAAAAGRR